jgi:predicted RNA-binding protein YlxR (DUF448 family)
MTKDRKLPLRKCVACHQMISKKMLIRIVRSPEGDVSFDPSGKKAGRGAYMCKQLECFKQVRKNRALERSLNTSLSSELYEQLQLELQKVIDHES